MSLTIRRLAPDDDRDRFSSGHPDLDRFFHRFAGQNQFRHHVGVTYIAVEDKAIDRPEPTPMFLPLSSIPCPDTP
ncbi:MAG: hypothetical protein KA142_12280 [Chromatiaceae bacterium]|nr:hypothetical protein [Chromatiaceae bacterium]